MKKSSKNYMQKNPQMNNYGVVFADIKREWYVMQNGEYIAICSKKKKNGENAECTISANFIPTNLNPKMVAPRYECHEVCSHYDCLANSINEGSIKYFELKEHIEN